MISKMIYRYTIINKKKTAIKMLSLIGAAFLITLFSFITNWSIDVMKTYEIQKSGSWHVQFSGLNEEQAMLLEENAQFMEVKSSMNHADHTLHDIRAEFKHVDKDIFQLSEEIASEIDMDMLADEEELTRYRPDGEVSYYDIIYHMELLEFSGIYEVESDEVSLNQLFLYINLLVMFVYVIFLYNIFWISYLDKQKYLALLTSLRIKRIFSIYFLVGESLFIGFIALPIGILLGIVTSWALIEYLSVGLQEIVRFQLVPSVLITIILLGIGTIILADVIPIIKTWRTSCLQLLKGDSIRDEKLIKQIKWNFSKSVELNMAIRNLLYYKGRTLLTCLLIIGFVVFSMNAYVYQNIELGNYTIKDERERVEPDAWLNIYTTMDEATKNHISLELEAIKGIEHISYVKELPLMGILIPEEFINQELQTYKIAGSGVNNPFDTTINQQHISAAHGVNAIIMGIEDEVFQSYANELGYDREDYKDLEIFVIIDDYLPIMAQDGKVKYQEMLDVSNVSDFTFTVGKYGDMLIGSTGAIVKDLSTIDLHVLKTTKVAPDIPKRPEEIVTQMNQYSQFEEARLKIYMPMNRFNQFIEKDEVKHIYESFTNTTDNFLSGYNRGIEEYFHIFKRKGSSDYEVISQIRQILSKYQITEYSDGLINTNKFESNSWEYESVDLMQQENEKSPIKWFEKMIVWFAIGLSGCFMVSCLINTITTLLIYRGNEFCVLKVAGMNMKSLKKMLLFEFWIPYVFSLIIGGILGCILVGVQFYNIQQVIMIEPRYPVEFWVLESICLGVILISITLLTIKKINRFSVIEVVKDKHY